MRVEIRDYRGVERADIELDPIALVAGNNEMGKSCVAEAMRAALTGNPIPIAGVLKKDARLLVRDGADHGAVLVTDLPNSGVQVNWPDCAVTVDGDPIKGSDYATGLTHVLDLNIKDRSKVLAHYMKSEPTKQDVERAAADAGYSDAAIAKIWESIDSGGWDHTYAKTREYTVTLKGQWQGVTGEKYGAKKGEGFRPGDDAGRAHLADCLVTAEQAVLDTAGAVAVSDAEVDNLKRKVEAGEAVENGIELNDRLNDARSDLADLKADRAIQPDDPKDARKKVKPMPCPECGAALTLLSEAGGGTHLITYKAAPQEKALSADVIKRRDGIDKAITEQEATVRGMEQKIALASRTTSDAHAAAKRLEEIAKAPKLDEATIELAKDAVGDARSALTAFDNKVKAYKVHGDLVKNDLLIKVLAPDGLRKRILAAKLTEFNESLDILCTAAYWPVVRIDENLDCHYGKRPLWAASLSGRWRARAAIQVVMAQMDGSAAVILDEADMLDQRGRNGLFKLLAVTGKACNLKALVCMTFSGRDKVPSLKQAGLGVSYWIEDGVAEAIS